MKQCSFLLLSEFSSSVHLCSPQFYSRIFTPAASISTTQPPGGVVDGQIFLSPLPAGLGDGEPQVNIPTGRWKDGLFDCFNAGVFHPSLWCAFCFTQGELYSTVAVSPLSMSTLLCLFIYYALFFFLFPNIYHSFFQFAQLEWDNLCNDYA